MSFYGQYTDEYVDDQSDISKMIQKTRQIFIIFRPKKNFFLFPETAHDAQSSSLHSVGVSKNTWVWNRRGWEAGGGWFESRCRP